MKIFKIETISQFRMVYFVEAKTKEDAIDTVVMRSEYDVGDSEFFDEVAQQHIGENIVCCDELQSRDSVRAWVNENKEISTHWLDDDRLIQTVDYSDDD